MKRGIVFFGTIVLLILLASCSAPATEQAQTERLHGITVTALQAATRPTKTVPPRPSATSTQQPTATAYQTPTASPVSEAFPYLALPLPEGAIGRLGKGILLSTAISPDGEYIAATSTIGVHMYRIDRPSGVAAEMWFGPTSIPLISAAFSADGKILATGGTGRYDGDSACNPLTYNISSGAGGGIQLWDAASGKPLRYYEYTGFITALAFSPDGKVLAAANPYTKAMLWNLDTGESNVLDLNIYPEDSYVHKGWVYGMDFSPDGSTLAIGEYADGGMGKYYSIQVWDWKNSRLLHALSGHSDIVLSVIFSSDGKTLASGSKDGSIILWDSIGGTEIRTLTGTGGAITELTFSPDGTLASGSEDGSISLWDAAAGTRKRTLHGHTQGISALRYSPDGATLTSTDESAGVIEWDAAAGKPLHTYTVAGYSQMISMSLSPTQNILASGDRHGNILLWDLTTRDPIQSLQGHSDWVYSIAFSPDGKRLASGSEDHRVILWDAAASGKSFVLSGHTERVNQVAFSPDGSLLASVGGDQSINLWDPATGRKLRTIQGNPGIAFSPDGKILASMSLDNKEIVLWNPSNGEVIGRFSYEKFNPPLVFSPDGSILAAANGMVVTLFAVSDEMEIHQPNVDAYYSQDIAFSPDGRIGAVASFTVNLWDVASGEATGSLAGHTCWTHSVAFSPDGKTVFSGSYDGTILIWDLAAILPAGKK